MVFAGKPSDFGQLPLAISPGGEGKLSGLIPSFLDAANLADDQNAGSFLALTWNSFAADNNVNSMVFEGNAVYILTTSETYK